jgi:hypothetical protein
MSALINITDFYALQHTQNEELANEVVALNDVSAEYGLTLTTSQATELIQTRCNALRDNGRIEIGLGAIKKIIECFCSSSFINPDNYAEILNDLLEIFYYFKTESHDKVSDIELIRIMFDHFENKYYGSIKLMQSNEFRFLKNSSKEPFTVGSGDDNGQEPVIDEYDKYLWDEEDGEE